MELSSYTLSLLEDIERRIDPEVEDDYIRQWESFWAGERRERIFRPERLRVSEPGVKLRDININDAIGDMDLMLASELTSLSKKLASRGQALGIRANYGTGIMTSLFGAEVFMMPRENNTLPTTRSFNDSDKIREILERGMPSLSGGFGGDVLRFGELCKELFAKYPKISKYVQVYHPDAQGPLDIAELLWGSEMFYEMYDEPDFVHSALRLITDTYRAFLERWYSIIPKRDGLSLHWAVLHRGALMIRLDSAMNLSPEFYDEFSKPYDTELFRHFGGGCMHFCGRGDHYIESLCEIPEMYGFNMSQPHLNDMNKVFRAAANADKRIVGFPKADEFVDDGVPCGVVHG
ncbi:MAG: hypothetical protein IJD79_09580 [Clostridia bacterium]|nr:hypothetical protein [Clostridia bacterium]